MEKNKKGEVRTKLYLRVTLILFILFLTTLVFTSLILLGVYISPLQGLLGEDFIVTAMSVIVSSYLASALIASFICYFIIRGSLKPFVELADKSIKVAQGDFTVSIEEKAIIPEVRYCLESFNKMVKKLNKVETLSNNFIANVSHEFKTPLSVIRSNINILESTDLTDEERKNCLSLINSSTDKLSHLISNVLKISRLDNESVNLELKKFRLDEQIRQCVLFFNDQIEEKHLSLDIELNECELKSDQNLLEQVWINLLSNAIKFSHDKGNIIIKLKLVEDYINVIIEDNGIGMNQETLEHIFDRFYQGEVSHNYEGNGLGLTIVDKILKYCNSSISVESEEGKYTRFTVKLKSFE